MASLYEEMLRIHSRSADEDDLDLFEADCEARDALGAAIVKVAALRTVGDAMALPNEYLRRDGLVDLIDRDARDEYDDVEGYVDAVLMEGVEFDITADQHGFDGAELCEWIDRTYPVQQTE